MYGTGARMVVMSDTQNHPYLTLGKHLRYLREQHSESLAEVSGAVEIDETVLERIEEGHERPAEEILMLLINHFNMQDQEAVQLWELAGYDQLASDERRRQEDALQDVLTGNKSVVVLMGLDSRTQYTDTVAISTDNAGLVLQFGQKNGKKQPQTLAKLGMSYDQATLVLHQLQMALLHAQHAQKPKQLPPSTSGK
jgi:transcriptional regulator with XRE-family HTH domain